MHVSNLNLNLIESDLQRMFAHYGEVKSIELIRDKWSNRSKGTAFIDMPVEYEGQRALSNLNGNEVMGKPMQVSEVRYDPSNRKPGSKN